ncbi:alpha/beta fold hydrolase [Nonomuraea sp. NPDC004186]
MVDEEIMADIVEVLPEGSDGVLPRGVGHFPFLEAPVEVNDRVLRFLAR